MVAFLADHMSYLICGIGKASSISCELRASIGTRERPTFSVLRIVQDRGIGSPSTPGAFFVSLCIVRVFGWRLHFVGAVFRRGALPTIL